MSIRTDLVIRNIAVIYNILTFDRRVWYRRNGFNSIDPDITIYEGHLKSTYHGIISLQCVDRILLTYIFLETGVHPLQDGLYIV